MTISRVQLYNTSPAGWSDGTKHAISVVPEDGAGNAGSPSTVVDGGNVALGTTTGAKVITDSTGTIQQYLRGLIYLLVTSGQALVTATLAAGSAIIGKVGIDHTTPGTTDAVLTRDSYAAAVSFTRPANTTAYTAGDAVGATAAAITFPTMGPSAKEVLLTGVSLEIDVTAIPSGMSTFRLHLYNVTPPSALADNAAWDLPAGDRASYLGYIDIPTPIDLGSTLYCEWNGVNKQVTLSGTSIFAYLQTTGAYTPAGNSEVYKATLHAMGL